MGSFAGSLISQTLPISKNNTVKQYLYDIKPTGITRKAN